MIQSVWKNLTGLQKAAEHLWCDFKWATNSSPNTNDLYIHYMDKSTGTPSLEEKTVPTKKFMYLKTVFPPLLQQFWSVWKDCTHMYKSLVFRFKFFHTDWIIISLWFLSYTQRHCHVRIEKSQPRISLYA